jgi:hypothetical protein
VGFFLVIDIYIELKNIMKKVIRMTESDLTRLVKRVIKEQEDIANLSILFECMGMDALAAGEIHLDEVSEGLDTIFDATQALDMDSNFDEEMLIQGLGQLQTSEVRDIQRYLSCFMKKTNIQIVDNNPLLTICRKAFTTLGRTDIGDSGLKTQAEKQLKRLGIATRI